MPTAILYELLWKPYPDGKDGLSVPSFFKKYNPLAVAGSLVCIAKPDLSLLEQSALLEDMLLSHPNKWAEYVAEGIAKNGKERKQLLADYCKFLWDASFYGFSVGYLASSPLDRIAESQKYHSAEKVLLAEYGNMPQALVAYLLVNPHIAPYTTVFRAGYDPNSGIRKRVFVKNKHLYRFKQAVEREIKQAVQSDLGIKISDMVSSMPERKDRVALLHKLRDAVHAYTKLYDGNIGNGNQHLPLEALVILWRATQREEAEHDFMGRGIRRNVAPLEALVMP